MFLVLFFFFGQNTCFWFRLNFFLVSGSGLIFLADQPELAAIIIQSLKGADSTKKEECLPLRYASILLSKGFFCGSREVGMILEMHLKVVSVTFQSGFPPQFYPGLFLFSILFVVTNLFV